MLKYLVLYTYSLYEEKSEKIEKKPLEYVPEECVFWWCARRRRILISCYDDRYRAAVFVGDWGKNKQQQR